MEIFYPFLVSFSLVFFSELGDKTQFLVLSFSTRSKTINILLGVAIGTFFSHGIAILFGSTMASFSNPTFQIYLKLFTYISFLLFGLHGFIPKKGDSSEDIKSSFFNKLSNMKLNYILIVSIAIMIGELGDKTFLASLGLGLQYPNFKISLIVGSICGMIASNSIAIFFGKVLRNHFNQSFIEFLSNILFILLGIIGLIKIFITEVITFF